MKTLTQTDRVGLLLASGYTKKEIAAQTGKSVNTVSKETDVLYKRTGCRNLADITRHMISRYTGVNAEEAFFRALQDVSIAAFLGVLIYSASHQRAIAEIKTAIVEFAALLTSLIN